MVIIIRILHKINLHHKLINTLFFHQFKVNHNNLNLSINNLNHNINNNKYSQQFKDNNSNINNHNSNINNHNSNINNQVYYNNNSSTLKLIGPIYEFRQSF